MGACTLLDELLGHFSVHTWLREGAAHGCVDLLQDHASLQVSIRVKGLQTLTAWDMWLSKTIKARQKRGLGGHPNCPFSLLCTSLACAANIRSTWRRKSLAARTSRPPATCGPLASSHTYCCAATRRSQGRRVTSSSGRSGCVAHLELSIYMRS